MDRRDALKRIGAGGAVLAGASVVVSQPAFAFAGPTATTIATLIATVPNLNPARVNLDVGNLGSTTCGGGSVTGNAQIYLDSTVTSGSALSPAGAFLEFNPDRGPGTFGPLGTTTELDFAVRKRLGTNNEAFNVGESFNVQVRVLHQCNYPGGNGEAHTHHLVGGDVDRCHHRSIGRLSLIQCPCAGTARVRVYS